MRLKRKSGGQPLDRAQPDFLLSPGFNLLKKILAEIRNVREFLLRQIMFEAQFPQSLANHFQRHSPVIVGKMVDIITSDRLDNATV